MRETLALCPLGRHHFPFFRTAPEGWKNTVRHNLCFSSSFEKTTDFVCLEGNRKSRLWKLTTEGRRKFQEEAQALPEDMMGLVHQSMDKPGGPSLPQRAKALPSSPLVGCGSARLWGVCVCVRSAEEGLVEEEIGPNIPSAVSRLSHLAVPGPGRAAQSLALGFLGGPGEPTASSPFPRINAISLWPLILCVEVWQRWPLDGAPKEDLTFAKGRRLDFPGMGNLRGSGHPLLGPQLGRH